MSASFLRRERDIEKRFKKAVAKAGGVSYKWSSPGRRGVPDQVVLFPGGKVGFVEIKRPGGQATRLQAYVGEALVELGFVWVVVSCDNEIDSAIKKIK